MTEAQAKALEMSKGRLARPNEITRIARETSEEAARWAFGQWELRKRARAKFALADRMFFEREALEMATHEAVAAYHASRFPPGIEVVDLTCGIGADLIAFARRGAAVGYEMDPVRAEYARQNLAIHGLSAEVREVDSRQVGGIEYLFCDPSRRAGGRRTLQLEEFSPDPREIAATFAHARLCGIKLSPMLPDRVLDALGGRLEFISFGGECREALVWIGKEAPPGRFAVHVESGETLPAAADPPRTDTPDRMVFEADPAAIRAHCLGEICDTFGLRALADSNGYLTGPKVVRTAWLTSFEILAWHAADLKRTRNELRRLGGGTPVVKSRVSGLSVEDLRKALHGEGEELVLLVYADGPSVKHAVARRV